jgi:UDP-N-acetylmuramyl pentapeptide synthase
MALYGRIQALGRPRILFDAHGFIAQAIAHRTAATAWSAEISESSSRTAATRVSDSSPLFSKRVGGIGRDLRRERVRSPVRLFVGLGGVAVRDLVQAGAIGLDGVDVSAEGIVAVAEDDLRAVR